MAKKASEENAYYKQLMQAVNRRIAREQKEKESKVIIRAGKELSVLLVWLFQVGMPIDLEEGKEHIVMFLKDYPKELVEVLKYYEGIKEYDVRKTMRTICPSIVNNELRVRINWKIYDLPIKDENTSQQEPQE